ncbi:STAS domain-containing protein [Litoribacter populi]|uniref:STAS domain-containing protein n=1 Tax=Litoribacter populi TaxID=2598460 RepID=UPI0011800B76|nr:STAS domain-containing protein [Litoribacter populi]
MNNVATISFQWLDSLKGRNTIKSAFNQPFSSEDRLLVDFAGVKFISRAAAHELLSQVDKLAKKGVESSFINLNEELDKMFDLVENSIGKEKQASFRFVKWLEFENESKYQKYLLQF